MTLKTRAFLVIGPAKAEHALRVDLPRAHLYYMIGEDFHLYRHNGPAPRDGIMVLSGGRRGITGDEAQLCAEVKRECAARSFLGVLADFEYSAPSMLRLLCSTLSEAGLPLFVPEQLGTVSDSVIVISTALSGGSLEERITEMGGGVSFQNIALGIERVRTDFTLPSLDGNGTMLDPDELSSLMARLSPRVFFSRELCANYFTYKEGNRAHFVLFDDGRSLSAKLALSGKFGIRYAFLPYDDWADVLGAVPGGRN